MPLAFESLNHGTIAFGFFNIDSDMLLLEQYFIFAEEFCSYISEAAEATGKEDYSVLWDVYRVQDRERIGDLMGAIHGIRFTGFIGEIYEIFPFPDNPLEFKQKPEGKKNRAIVKSIIGRYADLVRIPFSITERDLRVDIGGYSFDRFVFHDLIRYVWRGGYPRWREEKRPEYVLKMKEKIEASGEDNVFSGLILDN